MTDTSFVPDLVGPGQTVETPLPRLKDPSELTGLKPGQRFIDPTGKEGQKPFVVKTGEEWGTVPEGALYVDPSGAISRKPQTYPIGVGTQILYSMAGDPNRQQQILASVYGPDAVKRTPDGGWLVKQGNKWLRPGRGGIGPGLGFVAGNLAPTIGAVGGGILGGTVGIESGPGALVSASLGAGTGAVGGQVFNDMILGLMGYHITPEDQRSEMHNAALLGMAGEGAGRVLGAAAPLAGRLVTGLRNVASKTASSDALPATIRWVLGTDPAALRKATELAQGDPARGIPGVLTAPSSVHKEAPYIKKVVEDFDPVFRESPIRTGRDKYYEAAGGALLKDLGIEREQPLLSGTFKPDVEPAGLAMKSRIADDLAAANAQLDQALAAQKAIVTTQRTGEAAAQESNLSVLTAASNHLRDLAGQTVDTALKDASDAAEQAVKAAGAGAHPGDLWNLAGQQLDKVQLGIKTVSERGYIAGHTAAGPTPLQLAPVVQRARQLLDTLPEGFENQFPGAARQLEAMLTPRPSGVLDAEGKEILRIPDVTLEQAHNLRTLLRAKVDWTKPNATAVDHQAKQLARIVDEWMHSTTQPANVRAGVSMIDRWDDYYARNMGKFDQQAVQTIVQKMRAGFVDDAPALAKLVFDKDSTVSRENIRRLLGPTLWRAVQGADVKALIDASTNAETKQIDAGNLARLVEQRVPLWGDSTMGPQLQKLARQVSQIKGRVPLDAQPGDDLPQILQRANDFAAQAKALAAHDPIGLLEQETKRLDGETGRARGQLNRAAKADPLNFMATSGAIEAAERIMSSHDLTLAAAHRFGTDSPEFTLLRQAYVETIMSGGGIAKIRTMPESVQQILFPGVTKDTAIKIAGNMDFLAGGPSDFGGNLAAASRVLNPLSELRKFSHPLAAILEKIPGGAFIGRMTIGKYWATITWAVTHPNTLKFLSRGLEGTSAEQQAFRTTFREATARGADIGGALGAATGAVAAVESRGPAQRQTVAPARPAVPVRPTNTPSTQMLQSLPQ